MPYAGPATKKLAFTDRKSHPLLLDLIMIKEFGPEYLAWEPETCWEEVSRTFKVTTSELNKNKIQAIRTCHVSNRPYEAWEVFEKVAVCFGGSIPKFDLIQKPTPHVCGVTFEIMGHIKDKKISKEIIKYVAATLLDQGICYGPGPISPCNEYLRLYVGEELQSRVAKAITKGTKPSFDGSGEDDVQIFKALMLKDYIENDSRNLLAQTEYVFKEKT